MKTTNFRNHRSNLHTCSSRRTASCAQPPKNRRGFLLLAVLLVVSAVTLASLAFMKSMLLGHEESRLTGQSIQARYAADSGIDAARLFVAYSRAQRLEAGGSFDNPNTFQAIPVLQGSDPANPCNYSLIAPSLNEEGKYSGVRFGLQNESAKLNLNVLPMIDSALSVPAALLGSVSDSIMPTGDAASQPSGSVSLGRDLLMALPGMDESIADAILDFIDPDDEPREFGCEREYYTQLPNPYAPTNGPLSSIEQLLLVRGVTPYLLFGFDQNRNGVLESSESSAALTGIQPGMANAIGSMQATNTSSTGNATAESPPSLGWAMYLTLYSKERNLTSEGQPRVNINGADMSTLRTDLATALGDDVATFIIAYRTFGPANGGGGGGIPGITGGGSAIGGGQNPGGGRGNNANGQGNGGGGRGGNNGPGNGGPGNGGPGGGGGRGNGGPGGFGPGGGGPGGGPGGGGGGGRGGPGGGNRGGRSDFAWLELSNPLLSLVAMPQPPAGGRGGAGGGNRGGNAGGGSGRGGQAPGGGRPAGGQGNGIGGGGRGGNGPGGGPAGGFGGGGRGGNGPGGGNGRGDGNGPGGNNGPGGANRPGGNNPGGGFGGGNQGIGGIGGNNSGDQPTETRPWSASNFDSLGIDPALPGQFQVNGVLELIDASFVANVNGTDVRFMSPLTSSPVQMALYLPMLMDKVTTVEAQMLPGRININEAPREILAGLPGLSSDLLDKLMEARAQTSDTENRKYETWPMFEGILTLDQMKTLLPLVTSGGDVMRVQSVGYFEQSSGFARTEAVIDGSGPVPVIVLYRKLDHLGRGFSQSTLGQRAMMGAVVSSN
jgi:DNA uptake protein ComE-like DNA-binding protein